MSVEPPVSSECSLLQPETFKIARVGTKAAAATKAEATQWDFDSTCGEVIGYVRHNTQVERLKEQRGGEDETGFQHELEVRETLPHFTVHESLPTLKERGHKATKGWFNRFLPQEVG